MAERWTILGDGAMGTACAGLLAGKGVFSVSLWCQFAENAEAMLRDRENRRFLPGVPIDRTVQITSDPAVVGDSQAFVLAVPMVYLASTLERLRPVWPASGPAPVVVSVVKGMEQQTCRRPSEIVRDVLGPVEFVVLTGPMHAEEIARGMPASVVAAHPDPEIAGRVQRSFSTDRLRVYASLDRVGAELGGALKNVVAVAAGVCDGAGFGDNAKSALMTRGLVEMTRFGVAMGAKAATFYGLAGLGDLVTTCVSPHGRNRRVGERLGRGETLRQILADMVNVAEGVWTARSVHQIAVERSISMPVADEVYRILFEDKDVRQAVDDLMSRPLGEE